MQHIIPKSAPLKQFVKYCIFLAAFNCLPGGIAGLPKGRMMELFSQKDIVVLTAISQYLLSGTKSHEAYCSLSAGVYTRVHVCVHVLPVSMQARSGISV